MNEEEKEAIADLRKIIYNIDYDSIMLYDIDGFTMWNTTFEIVLKYIDKLQKENKELNKTIEQLENTIVELSTAMEE